MGQKPPIPLDVRISVGAQELTIIEARKLAFPKSFENWALSALVSYGLAHPGRLKQREENDASESSIEPIKRQAMDAIYLRTFYSSKKSRTCWIPMDYHVRMTLKQCVAKIKDKPET
ncbi:hypothetical protein FS837_001809 [Tulasnella sp. UAMH 9824]|nr:hypothetical protein FS837_001809 [Tulasnella sp. UAMH 9824]